jgi:hypothetical protein
MSLQVVNMMGQVVYSSMINVMDDVTVEDVNLTNMSAGTYMVRIVDGENSMIQTIIIE